MKIHSWLVVGLLFVIVGALGARPAHSTSTEAADPTACVAPNPTVDDSGGLHLFAVEQPLASLADPLDTAEDGAMVGAACLRNGKLCDSSSMCCSNWCDANHCAKHPK